MFETIYKGLTGLSAFSKGLDVLSNNIANLNTTGFKSSELSFRDLFYRYAETGDGRTNAQLGQGVDAQSTRTRFRQGEIRDTGNPLDIAVDGNGFLILHLDGKTFYSRSGQLELNKDGLLVERGSGGFVQALNGSTGLSNIDIGSRGSSPPLATTSVELAGNLTRNLGATGTATHEISNVTVIDAAGTSRTLLLRFSSTTPGVWSVQVLEPSVSTTAVIASGEIRYQGNGSPEAGFNSVSVTLTAAGAGDNTIALSFGEPGSFSGTTGFSSGTTSDARVTSQNGRSAGSLTRASFNSDGTLNFSYSNGETVTGQRLALAIFQDQQSLTLNGSSLFESRANQKPTIGRAGDGNFGSVRSEKIEISNVELTEQFTDLVIIQRGYQASSQVTTVANEMIQQILDLQSRR